MSTIKLQAELRDQFKYEATRFNYTQVYNTTRTYDCEPTLTDTEVLDFCRKGFLMLEGVVPDEVNRRAFAFLDENSYNQPTEILEAPWFIEHVVCNPQAAGAVRSLLGANFNLPILVANHLVKCPASAQGWHHDGGSQYSPELNYLQVFYYPQDTPAELGPTEVLPGSHYNDRRPSHNGRLRDGVLTTAPAGSIFLTIYPILHRRPRSTVEGIRNLLKYCYWRTVPPVRDWIIEPDFDLATANYGGFGMDVAIAQRVFWLWGEGTEFSSIGGQGWPFCTSNSNQMAPSYGFPSGLPRFEMP